MQCDKCNLTMWQLQFDYMKNEIWQCDKCNGTHESDKFNVTNGKWQMQYVRCNGINVIWQMQSEVTCTMWQMQYDRCMTNVMLQFKCDKCNLTNGIR